MFVSSRRCRRHICSLDTQLVPPTSVEGRASHMALARRCALPAPLPTFLLAQAPVQSLAPHLHWTGSLQQTVFTALPDCQWAALALSLSHMPQHRGLVERDFAVSQFFMEFRSSFCYPRPLRRRIIAHVILCVLSRTTSVRQACSSDFSR